tara:strand:- start:7050 stop:7598 length:549 start_codon:yes stop_codon:yes gene_type:complete
MKHIEIGNTDIFLEDLGPSKGKISITDTEGYNYSHFWGAMGGNLEEFITKINEDYFATKLKPDGDGGVFDAKLSVRAIRRFIKEECSYDLPWYEFMEFQKELREKLKDVENYSHSEADFVRRCSDIPDSFWSALDYKAEREFVDIIEGVFQEPWHFIVKSESKHVRFLKKLLPQIKKQLNKK